MKSSRTADGASVSSALLAVAEPGPATGEPDDQDVGDVPSGVDEDALNQDEIDTDQIANRDDALLFSGRMAGEGSTPRADGISA